MASSNVLPPQNGVLESFDSSEFSLISEQPPEEAELHYSSSSTVLQQELISARFDLSEEEIQKRLFELAEDNRSLRESLQSSSAVMKSELKAIAAWHNDITSTTAELKVSLQEAQKKGKELEKDKEELLQKLASYMQVGKIASSSSSDEDSEYEIIQKKSKDTESLNSQLKDADHNIALLMQKNQEQNLKLITMKKLNGDLEKEMNELKSKLVDCDLLNTKFSDLQKQLAASEDLNSALKLNVQKFDEKLQSHQLLADIELKDGHSTKQAEEYQEKVNAMKAEQEKSTAKLEAQIKFLEEKLANEKKQVEVGRMKNLEDKKVMSLLQANYDRVSKQLTMQSRKGKLMAGNMDDGRLAETSKNIEQIDNLTARLFDCEQRLEESGAKVDSLSRELTLAKEESGLHSVLKAQVELLKVDLESASLAKEAALEEAELANQQLKELQEQGTASFCSNCGAGSVTDDSRGSRGRKKHYKPSDSLARNGPVLYVCPVCQFGFTELQALENHVNTCLDKSLAPL